MILFGNQHLTGSIRDRFHPQVRKNAHNCRPLRSRGDPRSCRCSASGTQSPANMTCAVSAAESGLEEKILRNYKCRTTMKKHMQKIQNKVTLLIILMNIMKQENVIQYENMKYIYCM